MPDFSVLSESDRQAIANKDVASLSPEGIAFIKDNFSTTEPKASVGERFAYALKSAKTDVGNLATYLESEFPLGRLTFSFSQGIDYIPPEELYGQEFMNFSSQQRRDVLNRAREIKLEREYPQAAEQDLRAAGIIGTIAGSLLSPTTLIPISKAYQGYKGLAAVGAAYGAEYSVLEQLAERGKIDPMTTAGAAGIGAIAAPATSAIIKSLTPSARKSLIEKSNPSLYKKANQEFNDIQDALYDIAASGVDDVSEALSIVKNRFAYTDDQLNDIIIKSDAKIRFPSVENAREILSQRSALASPVARTGISKEVEDLLGILSTNVEKISKNAHAALIRHDFNVAQETSQYQKQVKSFYDLVQNVKSSDRNVLNDMMLNGDYEGMSSVLSRYSANANDAVKSVRSVLDDIAGRFKLEAGYKEFEPIQNYFPRLVKDYNGLLKSLGSERRSILENALRKRAKELGLNKTSEIPQLERTAITNAVLRGYNYNIVDGKLRFIKQRSIENVLPEMAKFYEDPLSSLNIYIERATNDINKRKFFGRNNPSKLQDAGFDESIGSYVDDAISAGEMSSADSDRLQELLSIRFGAGEMSANSFIQGVRNIGYSTTIGNPISAITQIGDMGMSGFMNGFSNTIKSLLGNKKVTLDELGIDNTIATELSSVGKTAKFLDKTLRAGLFKKIDKLGKETYINASYRKFKNMAKSDKGVRSIQKQYGKIFGDETGSLIRDLKSGNISDNVKLLLYSDLSGVQPISLSQMPVTYLNNPNGRIAYMLKTFAIKQLDILRRSVAQEYKRGNKVEAGKNLVTYMTIMPLMGATTQEMKDLLLGRGASAEDIITEGYVDNLFKVFGASEYLMDRYFKRGSVASALGEMVAPPLDWIDAIGTDVVKALNGEFVGKESKTMRQVPVVGRIWHNFFGGGLENYLKENK